MLNVIIRLAITQTATEEYPDRNKIFSYDFVSQMESVSTWANITDTLKLTLPKNITVLDQYNKRIPINGTNKYVGGGEGDTIAPLFLRGDRITVNWGYRYINTLGEEKTLLTGTETLPNLFEGVISNVGAGVPIELKCEDYMWYLKQIPAITKQWSGYTLQKMLAELIKGNKYGLSVRKDSKITLQYNIGDFNTDDGETVAQVVGRLRSEYGLYFYMRNKELRGGYPIYDEDEAREHTFNFFTRDIISQALEYRRKDDIVLSAVGTSEYQADAKSREDGETKTKTVCIQVLLTYKNGKFTHVVKKKGQPLPPNLEGERRDFTFNGLTTPEQIIEQLKPRLLLYYYTGFTGEFTTTGLPYVKHGDNVTLINPLQPDYNGRYKVKSVRYIANSTPNLRQVITIDYRIQN